MHVTEEVRITVVASDLDGLEARTTFAARCATQQVAVPADAGGSPARAQP
jgi:hypothetical protein